MALTETWCNGDKAGQNSTLQLPNYTLLIKLGVMTREEKVWQYMSITVLLLKYQKYKVLKAIIQNVNVPKLLDKTPRI